MDPWINSLVQSPLVRSLNTVPSRMSSFAFGVRDNVPPFSFVKEIVNSSMGDAWQPGAHTPNATIGQGGSKDMQFDIPQSGLLDRMYLRVRVHTPYRARPANAPSRDVLKLPADDDAAFLARTRHAYGSSMNFGNVISQVDLRTVGNKPIETLYPASIASSVQKLPSAQRTFWYQCLNGFAAGFASNLDTRVTPITYLYNPYIYPHVLADGAQAAYNNDEGGFLIDAQTHADFLIPLPFSLLSQLKDNLQTRFVDNLSVLVKFKLDSIMFRSVAGAAQGVYNVTSSLVCVYHNFHDVIENSIRDQNFKRGFPASIYSHNYKLESNATSVGGKLLRVNLSNKNLLSEIICILKSTAERPMYELPPRDGTIGPFLFKLYGSGRQIWEAYSWELDGPDTADYQLAEAHAYGEDLTHPVQTTIVSSGLTPNVYDAANGLADRIALGFPEMYSLRFGFQANDNFYTGGIALQTLSAPYLTIENVGSSTTLFDNTAGNYWSFDVVIKTCQMIRIDSDTGVITTSLDV